MIEKNVPRHGESMTPSARPQTNKPLVVFVDDEENILHGIKRLLRSRRDAWSMEFMTSAPAALRFLATHHADVVVSDMRMPEMDGAQFLGKVREDYPDVVRIVLSGYAEREAILKTIGPSHRYLAKPCSEETLVGAIEGALRLRALFTSESIKSSIAGLTHLPSLPSIYTEILQELGAELASADSLSAIVERDIAISAQLLKLTNSAYFGLPRHLATVKQAIQFLGFDNVRGVVLLAGVFEQFKSISPAMAQIVEDLAARSLAIGVAARSIARATRATQAEADEAFCAGLLSHVGTLMLIANSGSRFNAAMCELDHSAAGIEEVERLEFGASHAEFGAYLLNLWGFSDTLVEAVAYHHHPSSLGSTGNHLLTYVHAAQFLLRDLQSRDAVRLREREPLDSNYMSQVGMAGQLLTWKSICRSLIEEWSHAPPYSVH